MQNVSGKFRVREIQSLRMQDDQRSEVYQATISRRWERYRVYFDAPGIGRGDLVYVEGVLSPPKPKTMPYILDTSQHLRSQGIRAQLQLKTYRAIGSTFFSDLERIRGSLGAFYERVLPAGAAQLARGLILRDAVDGAFTDQLRHMGLAHVLSVSGLHVGLIYSVFYLLCCLCIPKRKIRRVLSLLALWLYAAMIGWSPSVLRATMLVTVVFFSDLFFPALSRLEALSICWIASLCYEPYYAFHAGFLLSYVCVWSMIVVAPQLERIFRWRGKAAEALYMVLAIQGTTLPLVLYYFNGVHMLSMIWNLLLLPVFSLFLTVALLLPAIVYLPLIGNAAVTLLSNLYAVLERVIHLLSTPGLYLLTPSPSVSWMALYWGGFALAIWSKRLLPEDIFKGRGFSRRTGLLLLCGCLTSLLASFSTAQVSFLDVGQGDCALLEVGGKRVLIDAGGDVMRPNTVGPYILEPFLVKSGKRRIDVAWISHYDYDHYGGIAEMSDRVDIRTIMSDHAPPDDVATLLQGKGKAVEVHPSGTLYIADGYVLRLMPISRSGVDENARSGILSLEKDGVPLILFTGDIGREEEESFITAYPDFRVPILKVPHHGSDTSSSLPFLQQVQPSWAVFSVGRGNRFGHPHPEVVRRYASEGIGVVRTDRQGMVTVNLQQNIIRTYLPRGRENATAIYCALSVALAYWMTVTMRRKNWTIGIF